MYAQAPSMLLPSDFATAHTVFLAPAGATPESNAKPITQAMYASLLHQLANAKRYKSVYSPRDADLLLEISNESRLDVRNDDSFHEYYLKLVIRESKTHALLWTLEEPLRIHGLVRIKNVLASMDETTGLLVSDLNQLADGTLLDVAKKPTGTQP
jgi:hypothetical protein